jgi:hexosaminidase
MRLLLLLVSFLLALNVPAQEIAIIPRPVSTKVTGGVFHISPSSRIRLEGSGLQPSADFLNDYLQQFYGMRLAMAKPSDKENLIVLNFDRIDYPIPGAYHMDVAANRIYIGGDNPEGVFYGIQTLIQLLPVTPAHNLEIPQVQIDDHPRFAYRGLHLDVGRHFFPASFVKKYIDFIALHKMNFFHWHLTEDQGWRIEIKKYPELTRVGSCRSGTIIGRYPGKGNDSIRYCGYYTQEEVREVVKYAAARFITIIPEIEMPGHASAALAAYPFLGCTGGPYQVAQTWGVFNDVFCAGNDSTFQFLENVLDEVMALFPAPYIHIGGDECPKTSWKKCLRCQQRIKDNHLKDEHELQSYFIQRIEKYVNSKGKRIIGWDEILEGGLAPNATVMSWRGENGGIAAAKQHHKVIMTPGNYVYFDHAQKRNEDSVNIGGYLPLETVYNYEPLPKALSDSDQKFIIGAQANMWTEYMANIPKVEYMLFPRLSALSEVLWSPREARDWNDFQRRLSVQFKRFDLWKANFSRAYFDLKAEILPAGDYQALLWKLDSKNDPKKSKIVVSIQNPGKKPVICPVDPNMYGGQGSLRDSVITDTAFSMSYGGPIRFASDIRCDAKLYMYDESTGQFNKDPLSQASQQFFYSLSTGKKISLTTPPATEFPGNGGAFGLVNGAKTEKPGNFTEWLGWVGTDMEAVIDLGSEHAISNIIVHTMDQKRGRYYQPVYVQAFGSSKGVQYDSLGRTSEFNPDHDNIGNMTVRFSPVNTRYVKVFAKNAGTIAEGQPGAGNPARMLIDEISID